MCAFNNMCLSHFDEFKWRATHEKRPMHTILLNKWPKVGICQQKMFSRKKRAELQVLKSIHFNKQKMHWTNYCNAALRSLLMHWSTGCLSQKPRFNGVHMHISLSNLDFFPRPSNYSSHLFVNCASVKTNKCCKPGLRQCIGAPANTRWMISIAFPRCHANTLFAFNYSGCLVSRIPYWTEDPTRWMHF